MISLDKYSGLCLTDVSEIVRRIVGKVVIAAIRDDVISSAGSLQVCADDDAGGEVVVHTINSTFLWKQNWSHTVSWYIECL